MLRTWGPNQTEPAGPDRPWQPLLRLTLAQLRNPLVAILAAGAALALFTGSGTDAALVLFILLATGALGIWQEWRADRAMRMLGRQLALTARVWRDGRLQTLPARLLVPGDVIDLRAGDLIPADARLIDSVSLTVVEASLTGESMPVEKGSTGGAVREIWAGTSVRSGLGTALIIHTGARTRVAALAQPLSRPRRISPFMQGVADFGVVLMRLLLGIVVVALVGQAVQGRSLLEGLVLAMALAVGLSPELLPVIVSVTLSQGAWRMTRHGVLLRRLDAMEDLGSLDVLCTDKTGTLTQGRMRLVAALGPDDQASEAVLRLAVCNAVLETGMANPLDEALVQEGHRRQWYAAREDTPEADRLPVKRAEIPYDFVRRRLTIAVQRGGGHIQLITKGAVREVLMCCGEDLDERQREAVLRRFEQHSQAGLRVLAVATRTLPETPVITAAQEADMRFEGLLLFEDPPRDDARQTLQSLAERGIGVKIITGDNRHVAQAVARAVGLPDSPLITGAQLASMRDEALWHHAQAGSVFAEIDPQQKELIVRALQRQGRVVGFLGDGINDAPALSAADIGISAQGAADVAGQSADLVLTRADLQRVAQAVDEGRRSFINTRKYVVITASANFGNMVSMAVGGWVLPFTPMTAHQILLNNLLSDVPALALSQDRVDEVQMQRPRHWDAADLKRAMWVFGLTSTVFDLLLFALLGLVLQVQPAVFQSSWFVASLATELAVLLSLRTMQPVWRSLPSRGMAGACAAVLAIGVGAVWWPPSATLLGFESPTVATGLTIAATVMAYAVSTEWVKQRLALRSPAAA